MVIMMMMMGGCFDSHVSGLTRKDCQDKISRMLLVKAGVVKPLVQDYNDVRRYQVLEFELNGQTVQRLVKIGTNLNNIRVKKFLSKISKLAS